MNINSKAKGFVCGAVAAATYGMNPLFTLPLYKEGMSVDSVLFYRYGFAVLILGILMKVQGQSFALKKNEVLPLIVGGLLSLYGCRYCLYNPVCLSGDGGAYHVLVFPRESIVTDRVLYSVGPFRHRTALQRRRG